jgi:hypothetical protein
MLCHVSHSHDFWLRQLGSIWFDFCLQLLRWRSLTLTKQKKSRIRLFQCNLLFDTITRRSPDPASVAVKTNFQLKLPMLPSLSGKRFILLCLLPHCRATIPPSGHTEVPGHRLATPRFLAACQISLSPNNGLHLSCAQSKSLRMAPSPLLRS